MTASCGPFDFVVNVQNIKPWRHQTFH